MPGQGFGRGRSRCAILAAAVTACVWLAGGTAGVAAGRTVTLRTEDGLTLSATWYEPSVRPAPAVILVHMLKGSRRDWDGVASRLASEGIGAIALDLRGHGDSQSVPLPEAPPDFAAMVADLTAARRFLASRPDVQPTRIGIAGASLGASLAVLAASSDTAIVSLALLSPSLDYRGLRIEAAVRKYAGRPILLISSGEDAYAGRTVKDLQKAGSGTREALTLSGAGHGTHMLSRAPELSRSLVDWFRRTL
jgi:dienelactone hydrolase